MRTEQIVKLQKEVTRLKNENKHYRIEKEASLLANKLINSYVEELEEDKKAMGDLIEKTAKIAWNIEQQNKRYREALEEIKGATSHNKYWKYIAFKALEGEE